MPEFVVVDLGSRAQAVARFVAGWSRQQFLDWLGQYGEIMIAQKSSGIEVYAFLSHCGVWSNFSYYDDDQLVLQASLGRSGVYSLAV